MANYNQNIGFQGLGTVSVVVPFTDQYVLDGKIQLPNIPAGSPVSSSLVVTINKNGSPQYVGNAGSRGFRSVIACSAGDTLAIVFSSAAAVDVALNAIQSTISIYEGGE